VQVDSDIPLNGDCRDSFLDLAFRLSLDLRRARAQVHAKHRDFRNDVARAPAVDPRGVHAQPVALQRIQPKCQVGGGDERIAAVFGIAAGMG
jgi:hypothetical protein